MGRGKLTPDQVKTIRERLGMTQQELATACDMTLSSVSRWERGLGVPSRVATRTIKEVLRRHYLEFDNLWGDEPQNKDGMQCNTGLKKSG